MIKDIKVIFNRELRGYFDTPVAYVFVAIFILLSGIFTFYLGGFYESGQADLAPFFMWHLWLYLFLVPAISMRLWAEERRSGTIEFLNTLPISTLDCVIGKFFAAWAFCAIALFLTLPIWITVNYLGDPDNGVIIAGYIGSLLSAGGFLAVGSCMSATTRNQVVAFVISITVCFLFIVSGFPMVLDFFTGSGMPQLIIDMVSYFSFSVHFDDISKGIISISSIIYFASFMAFWLFVTAVIIDSKKA
ncbi:ABC transporter permease [Rickettsiales bacterium]|nr:ABC transporter permease [Rickettsiales bacterium]